MRKKLALLTSISVLLSMAACAESGDDSSSEEDVSSISSEQDSEDESSDNSSESEESSDESSEEENDDSDVAESNISVVSHEVTTDYSGRNVLLIEYSWTNTSDENKSFMLSFTDQVFQNGIECENAYFFSDGNALGDTSAELQPGATQNVKVGYYIGDMTTALVMVTEAFSWDDELVVNEAIDLGGGKGYGSSVPNNTGDTYVKYVGHSVGKDYDGDDILTVAYEFHNGSDEPESFAWNFSDKVFQNGIECEKSYFTLEETEGIFSSILEILPGVVITVAETYKLSDMSDVTIEVTDLFGSKDYVSETISLN